MKKILLIMILSLSLITGCDTNDEINNSKMNNHTDIIKEQTVNGLTMSDVSLSYKDGISTFGVTINNNTSESVTVNKFDIVFKTENGTTITTLNGSLGEILESNSSITITITSDIDLSEAYSLEYQID